MTATTLLADLLIIAYFVLERRLRQGEQALSLAAGKGDRYSSQLLWSVGLLNLLLVLAAPRLNDREVGYLPVVWLGWLGILLMLGGLLLRYWAAKTLGQCYTRTLQTIPGQQIIDRAPYNFIRHPGYLGTLLLELGASLAVSNWIVLLSVGVGGGLVRLYRIQTEEEMLSTAFGEDYKTYQAKTWKLIPFVY